MTWLVVAERGRDQFVLAYGSEKDAELGQVGMQVAGYTTRVDEQTLIRFGVFSRGKWHIDTAPDSSLLAEHITACGREPEGRSIVQAGHAVGSESICKPCAFARPCGCGGRHASCPAASGLLDPVDS